jgi:hypothetical protein
VNNNESEDFLKSEGSMKIEIQFEKKEKRYSTKKRSQIKLNEVFVLRSNLLKKKVEIAKFARENFQQIRNS